MAARGGDDVLPEGVRRLLADRAQEKRKQGAGEVVRLISHLRSRGQTANVRQLLQVLAQEYAVGNHANLRKGGVSALASAALALREDVAGYLDVLVPPVVARLTDTDPRVRYYAVEAAVHVVSTAELALLDSGMFLQVFGGLCRIAGDSDDQVREGMRTLNSRLKDVAMSAGEDLDVEGLIPLLSEHSASNEASVRMLVLDWFNVIENIPGVELVDYLPEVTESLLLMLTEGGDREVNAEAQRRLSGLRTQVSDWGPADVADKLDVPAMVAILTRHSRHGESTFARVQVAEWARQLCRCAGGLISSDIPKLLDITLAGLADSNGEVRDRSQDTNVALRSLVEALCHSEGATIDPDQESPDDDRVRLSLGDLLHTVTAHLNSSKSFPRAAAIRWTELLLELRPTAVLAGKGRDALLSASLKNLSIVDDSEMSMHVQMLADLARRDESGAFQTDLLKRAMDALRKDTNLAERRGAYILRHFCVVLDARAIYCEVSEALAAEPATVSEDEGTALLMEMLALVLFTAPELAPLRSELRQCLSEKPMRESEPSGPELFSVLFRPVAADPISAFLLSLMAGAHDLAAHVISTVPEEAVTVSLLMRADRAVQLLESPVFVDIRMELLHPTAPSYAALLEALYGLLMILPQSAAYHALRDRLTSAASLQMGRGGATSSRGPVPRSLPDDVSRRLIAYYNDALRNRHERAMQEVRELDEEAAQALLRVFPKRPDVTDAPPLQPDPTSPQEAAASPVARPAAPPALQSSASGADDDDPDAAANDAARRFREGRA